jgi:membrane associated rhomboid family serine protease
MGLDSRDYMQDEDGGAARAARGWFATLSATGWLVLVNVVVFVLWQVFAPSVHGAGLGPLEPLLTVSADGLLQHGRVWTLVTYAFSHTGLFHLAFNMLFLHWLGRDLEVIYGRRNVVALYVVAGVVGGLAQVAWSIWRHEGDVPLLGASGSIMAIAVVATLFFPRREVRLWGIVPLPLWLLTALFVAIDLLGATREQTQGVISGTGYACHLGGAAFGIVWQRLDLRPFRRDGEGSPGLLGRLQALAPVARAGAARAARPLDDVGLDEGARIPGRVDAATAARVDALLQKIHEHGLPSLTADERAFLDEASSKYRR